MDNGYAVIRHRTIITIIGVGATHDITVGAFCSSGRAGTEWDSFETA